MFFRLRFVLPLLLALRALVHAADTPAVGPFFEPTQPFFQSQVEVFAPAKGQKTGESFVVRGLVLPLASGHCVLFDQELLRVAAIWQTPAGSPPITPRTMAQISYVELRRKADSQHPRPTGPVLFSSAVHPGVGDGVAALFFDPRRPASDGDVGRGPLPTELARFEGVELAGDTAILSYRVGGTLVREWHESRMVGEGTQVLRHFEIAAHATPLVIGLGNSLHPRTTVGTNSAAIVLGGDKGEFAATFPPSAELQRATISHSFDVASGEKNIPPTPPLPAKKHGLRWPGTATAPAQLDALAQNGLILDRIAVPESNPWGRRVRVADLAFLTDDRAAVVTYDGDVWLVDGLADPKLARLTWRRFASGLHEPLAIVAPRGVVQVATKNGVVRLHDRDGDGEADWFENFSDLVIQAQTTRSFPLDMAIGPDGSTYVAQGGIVSRSGMAAGGEGTAHTGGIVRISPDGRTAELIGAHAREPYLAVHPRTGVVTATDQQGHYIPSSVCYLVQPGADFGYPEKQPAKLTPPLVWVPHAQDTSSASQLWMVGEGMGPWNGRLLHLSYGTARLFVITPDLDAPVPQGAVIPLDLQTDLPLLHARMNPRGDAVFFAGLQIYGTRSTPFTALGRLRVGSTPVTTAVAARSCADGVILEFATPIDPASLGAEKIRVRAWNYQRSSAYGSGRYALDGTAGTTPWGVAQTVLSTDRKSVFVHLPKLPAVAQLELSHDFKLANGAAARGVVFFTVNQPHALNLASAGFHGVDLTKAATVIAREKEAPATIDQGKTLAETLGCVACHSPDGTTEGKVGPTWKGLFGAKRTFVNGTSEVADEVYLREKILDPTGKPLKPGTIEMPSYRGVLSEVQIDSITLYIKSLAGRRFD
jgi:glucose/arabinose dehydrogenase/mono/diheme cytochrome c family protein